MDGSQQISLDPVEQVYLLAVADAGEGKRLFISDDAAKLLKIPPETARQIRGKLLQAKLVNAPTFGTLTLSGEGRTVAKVLRDAKAGKRDVLRVSQNPNAHEGTAFEVGYRNEQPYNIVARDETILRRISESNVTTIGELVARSNASQSEIRDAVDNFVRHGFAEVVASEEGEVVGITEAGKSYLEVSAAKVAELIVGLREEQERQFDAVKEQARKMSEDLQQQRRREAMSLLRPEKWREIPIHLDKTPDGKKFAAGENNASNAPASPSLTEGKLSEKWAGYEKETAKFLRWGWVHTGQNFQRAIDARAYAKEMDRTRYDVMNLLFYLEKKELIEKKPSHRWINEWTLAHWDGPQQGQMPLSYLVALTLPGLEVVERLTSGHKKVVIGVAKEAGWATLRKLGAWLLGIAGLLVAGWLGIDKLKSWVVQPSPNAPVTTQPTTLY